MEPENPQVGILHPDARRIGLAGQTAFRNVFEGWDTSEDFAANPAAAIDRSTEAQIAADCLATGAKVNGVLLASPSRFGNILRSLSVAGSGISGREARRQLPARRPHSPLNQSQYFLALVTEYLYL